jgi:hypothetical protein
MTTVNPADAVRLLCAVADALEQTVKEAGPDGAPAGPLYLACMEHGCTLGQFEGIMGALVDAGRLRKQGHLYFAA